MLNVKPTLMVFCLAVAVASLDQFESPKEMAKCIETCQVPISACLEEMESACAKAYTHCNTKKKFIICIESANGIMMQNIAKCMRRDCKPIQQVQTSKKVSDSEHRGGFMKFKQVSDDNDDSGDSADDIQDGSSNKKVLSDPNNSSKYKQNRR